MSRSRRRWLLAALILGLITAFAVVGGGFLWPRPQFRLGPWAVPDTSSPALE